MTDIFLLTFNCAKTSHPGLATHLPPILPAQEPAFFVFGFQELLSIWDSMHPAKVSSQLRQLQLEVTSVLESKYGGSFQLVRAVNFGAVGQIVLTKREVDDVESSYASIGYLQSNLKAAVGCRFKYDSQLYTFITAHLSANEGFAEKRNSDYWNIVRNLKFKSGLFEVASHTFFQGDLNYRALRRDSNDDPSLLHEIDELNRVRRDRLAFVGFEEQEVAFPPTYKYKPGTKTYNVKRIPSWCDRILYTSKAAAHKYDSLKSVNSSDHEPVYLHITVNIPGAPIVQEGKLIVEVPEHLKELTFDGPDPLQRQIGDVVDYILWFGLWLGLTTSGRVTSGVIGFYLLYRLFSQ